MIDAFRNAGSLFLAVAIFSLFALNGCENPGSIGDGIAEAGADVSVDTFLVGEMANSGYNWYSGDYEFFSAGSFDDPYFGSLTAIGMLKPSLPSGDNTVGADASMKLRLILDGSETYGDSLTGQSFSIYEVEELWRGRAFMLQDELQLSSTPVGSFEIGEQDSMDVELSDEYINAYRQFSESDAANADSLYRYSEYGLALVPENSTKIIGLNARATSLVVENPESDTFSVSISDWAYQLQRENEPEISGNSLPVHSTLENVLSADLNLTRDDVPSLGISRAELVFYENREALGAVDRTSTDRALLYLANPDEAPENIGLGNPVAQGSYSAEDRSFRFNITSMVQNIVVNGMPEGEEFFMTLPNEGIIRSSLIYTDQAPAERAPKLIITSIKSSD